jgi:hypothetical protein
MPHLVWEVEAASEYERLIQLVGDRSDQLLNSIDRTLDLLEDSSKAFASRRRLLRTNSGVSIWKIEIRHHNGDWSLLWLDHPQESDAVLILYLGPVDYEARRRSRCLHARVVTLTLPRSRSLHARVVTLNLPRSAERAEEKRTT